MGIEFHKYSLDFPRRWEDRESPLGTQYRVWASYGMPRIKDVYLNCVFYLYADENSALAGNAPDGSGFFVGVESKDKKIMHLYAVSNQHVVHDHGASIIRCNTVNGGFQIFPLDPADWESHPNGDDVAACLFKTVVYPKEEDDPAQVGYFTDEIFVFQHSPMKVGVGDDVFMIGNFIHHPGIKKNHPSVRFGHISVMPNEKEGIRRKRFRQESYLLDMRSQGGYSGAPVFVYRLLTPAGPSMQLGFLGVHWGASRTSGKHEGITYAVPAWKVKELLMTKTFIDGRKKIEARAAKTKSLPDGSAEMESRKKKTKQINPNHKEDFNLLLDKAVKGKKAAD